MLLTLAVGFGLGVLATVVAGERDKRRPVRFDLVVEYPHRHRAVFGNVSLTKTNEPVYGRCQDHT